MGIINLKEEIQMTKKHMKGTKFTRNRGQQ